jgi:hypothetical protein
VCFEDISYDFLISFFQISEFESSSQLLPCSVNSADEGIFDLEGLVDELSVTFKALAEEVGEMAEGEGGALFVGLSAAAETALLGACESGGAVLVGADAADGVAVGTL